MDKNDLISRSELKKVIETYRPMPLTSDYAQGKNNMIDYCIAEIDSASTITPDEIQALMSDYLTYRCEPERQQGEWIKWNFRTIGPLGTWDYKCSNCEKVYYGEYNFCPNCGSVMKGGAE